MADAGLEPPKENFNEGPLSVLQFSVKKNCQVLSVESILCAWPPVGGWGKGGGGKGGGESKGQGLLEDLQGHRAKGPEEDAGAVRRFRCAVGVRTTRACQLQAPLGVCGWEEQLVLGSWACAEVGREGRGARGGMLYCVLSRP